MGTGAPVLDRLSWNHKCDLTSAWTHPCCDVTWQGLLFSVDFKGIRLRNSTPPEPVCDKDPFFVSVERLDLWEGCWQTFLAQSGENFMLHIYFSGIWVLLFFSLHFQLEFCRVEWGGDLYLQHKQKCFYLKFPLQELYWFLVFLYIRIQLWVPMQNWHTYPYLIRVEPDDAI